MQSQENIALIKDVPLEVTVELGRTSKAISDILDFAPGTIIELDKIAGEPVDVLVNGKLVAKGEVVVKVVEIEPPVIEAVEPLEEVDLPETITAELKIPKKKKTSKKK